MPTSGRFQITAPQDAFLTLADTDQFFVTELANFDGVNALDFASAESQPDRAIRVFVDHREVWVFGPKTIEVFYNAGGADFPFSRANEAAIERGLVGKFTPAKMDNTVFWLGEDLEVKRADGYVPVRISTHALERCIADLTPEQREQLRGFIYREEGHKFYCLWFPNGTAWLYDAATGMWHERGTNQHAWMANTAEHAYGTNWAAGNSGGLFIVDRDYFYDDDQPNIRQMVSGPVHDGQNRFSTLMLSIDIRAGFSELESEPQMRLFVSKDRGHTWYEKGKRGLGVRGQFEKLLRWWGFGLAREIMYRIEVREPVSLSVYGAHTSHLGGEA